VPVGVPLNTTIPILVRVPHNVCDVCRPTKNAPARSGVEGIANVGRRLIILLGGRGAHPVVLVVALGGSHRERPTVLLRNVVLGLQLEDLVPRARGRGVMLAVWLPIPMPHVLARSCPIVAISESEPRRARWQDG
jgi:hypothetical protein